MKKVTLLLFAISATLALNSFAQAGGYGRGNFGNSYGCYGNGHSSYRSYSYSFAPVAVVPVQVVQVVPVQTVAVVQAPMVSSCPQQNYQQSYCPPPYQGPPPAQQLPYQDYSPPPVATPQADYTPPPVTTYAAPMNYGAAPVALAQNYGYTAYSGLVQGIGRVPVYRNFRGDCHVYDTHRRSFRGIDIRQVGRLSVLDRRFGGYDIGRGFDFSRGRDTFRFDSRSRFDLSLSQAAFLRNRPQLAPVVNRSFSQSIRIDERSRFGGFGGGRERFDLNIRERSGGGLFGGRERFDLSIRERSGGGLLGGIFRR